jgi:hypothetical protein
MGDDDVTVTGPIRATWASIEPASEGAGELARFALMHALREVFLVVPWGGAGAQDSRTAALLRGEGLTVAAVGADPRWATDPRALMQWIRRVRLLGGGGNAQGTFSGVHLDVEPWRLPLWDRDRLRATRGLVTLVRHARELVPDLPLSADLPHWLAGEPYWPPLEADGQEAPTRTSRGRGDVVPAGHAAGVWEPPSAPAAAAPSSERRSGGRSGNSAHRPRIREVGAGGAVAAMPTGTTSSSDVGRDTGTDVDERAARSARHTRSTWSALVDEPGLPAMRAQGPSGVAAPRRSRASVFEAMLDHLDSVTILVPRTRAHGQGGILDVSAKARSACMQRDVPYMIGLETRPTSDPRRPRATFHDAGALALAREADRLREALGTDPLFLGVAVHDWAAWSVLH